MELNNHLARNSSRIVYSCCEITLPEDCEDVDIEKVPYEDAYSMGQNGEFDDWVLFDGFDAESGHATGGIIGYIKD